MTKATKSLHKPFHLRWGQNLWAALGRWSRQYHWPFDTVAIRLLMLPLFPLYMRRHGFATGLSTLYRFMRGEGGFTVSRSELDPGVSIREDSTDAYVYQQIFILDAYDKAKDRDEVRVIIDAGAYVGYSSIYLAEMYPHAFIYALEPEESNFQALQRNTRHYPNILAIQAALWNHDGDLIVEPGESGQWSFVVHEGQKSKTAQGITAITIQTLMEQYRIPRIDILKIDIEGAESAVFEASSCHSWLPKVQLLIIELHDHLFPGSDQNFLQAMARYDFDVQYSGENVLLNFYHPTSAELPLEKTKQA